MAKGLVGQQGAAGAVRVVQIGAHHVGALAIAEGHLTVLHQGAVDHALQHHEVLLPVELPVLHLSSSHEDISRVKRTCGTLDLMIVCEPITYNI